MRARACLRGAHHTVIRVFTSLAGHARVASRPCQRLSSRQFSGLRLTDLEFLNSTALGLEYAYNLFVGDINNGNLYYLN